MSLEILGPYLIDRELGSGGMGKVYAAVVDGRVPGLDKGTRVALKVVHAHLLETPGFFKRFLREVEIGKTVRHPNVVRTYDCDATGEQHFMAMEYVEGQTLRELLVELDRVPEELCRHIGCEVAKGLSAIHATGVIHRDMKPENVLITEEHVVKVMDLGVARLADEALRLSQTGAFVGSLHYAAPESFQSGGAEMDGRVDLHALGLVLYELACGANPYLADDVPKTIQRVLRDEPRKLGDVNPQLSPFFEEVVHCLLEKDKEKRFGSADELAKVLADGEDSAWWRRRASMIRTVTKRPLRRVRIPRETAVYGREDELTKLRTFYDAAKSGEGNVVLIEGEAGIGKSRLIDELIGRMQRDGEDINFLFGSYPPGGAATAAGGFSTAYREQFGEEGCADHLGTTPVLVPAFDALLRGEPTPDGQEPLTKDSLQTCFVNATRALGTERPTVVLIDDLHFAPDEGRALFTSLAMAVPGHRVLLIGTTRPGVSEEWLSGATRLDQTSQIALQRLGPKDLFQLLKDTLKSERLAHDLSGQISVKSDGNPFFVFEIIRGLREGQFITQQEDGTWVGTRVIDDIQIPASVLDLVNARVADLSEEERDLLDVACCWGFEFDPALIGEVLGMGRIPVLKRFGQVERKHRLVRSIGRNYVFDHHQVQEALYQGLNEQLREEYHAALAEALETGRKAADQDPETLDGALCVDLCEHYLNGARGESAVRYLPAAQAHLGKGYLHAQVVALGERALAAPDLLTGSERADVLSRLCRVNGPLDMLGRRDRQEELAREADALVDGTPDYKLQLEIVRALCLLYSATARHDEAEAEAHRAIEIARAHGDHSAEAMAGGDLGFAYMAQYRHVLAHRHLERYLTFARKNGDLSGEAAASGGLGHVSVLQGRLDEAQRHFERQLTLSHELRRARFEAAAIWGLSNVLWHDGRFEKARAMCERAIAKAREIGDRHGECGNTVNLGGILGALGRADESLQWLERGTALCREIGQRAHETNAHLSAGYCLWSLGRIDDALAKADEARALARDIGQRRGEAAALDLKGISLLQQGEYARAEECVVAGLTVREEYFPSQTSYSHYWLGAVRAAARGSQHARESFVTARDSAAEFGVRDIETLARCQLVGLGEGDVEETLSLLTDNEGALKGPDRGGAHFLLWKATGDRKHLESAKRSIDESLSLVSEQYHESMRTNLRVNREILAAWQEHGG